MVSGWPGKVLWGDLNEVERARVAVGAVARTPGNLDVFVVAQDGRVKTSGKWESILDWGTWQDWWQIGQPSFLCIVTDPAIGAWEKIGTAYSIENYSIGHEYIFTNDNQGAAIDEDWTLYVASNDAVHKTLTKFSVWADIGEDPGAKKTISVKSASIYGYDLSKKAHVGAPSYWRGWIYVPIQDTGTQTFGVYKVRKDFGEGKFLAGEPGEVDFTWGSVNPLNGRYYASAQIDAVPILKAYDLDTLERRPEDDIALTRMGVTAISNSQIQAGCFTERGHFITVHGYPAGTGEFVANTVFCFSSLTGHCYGATFTGQFDHVWSELEDVAIAPMWYGGVRTWVQISENNNEEGRDDNPDDFYLYSYSVPFEDLL